MATLATSGTELHTSEYMSFSDGFMFLGLSRPNPGAVKIDVSDPTNMQVASRIWGRMDLNANDDQFSTAIGALLVLSDDEKNYGSVIAVHSTDPDKKAPTVDTIIPKPESNGQPVTSRVGISFSDQRRTRYRQR